MAQMILNHQPLILLILFALMMMIPKKYTVIELKKKAIRGKNKEN